MTTLDTTRITMLLQDIDAGRDGAMDALMQAVYSDLENVAHRHMRERFGGRMERLTLEPAGLVNESFLRLIKQRKGFDNRGQFFAVATRVMLRVLVDYCRSRNAAKRGGNALRVSISFDDALPGESGSDHHHEVEIGSLMDALDQLEQLDKRKAEVVKMRIVWGMKNEDIAEALDVSLPTVERDWRFARAWLADATTK